MGKKMLLTELFLRSILPPFYSFKMIEKVCKSKLEKRPIDKNVLWILSNLYINHKKYNEARVHLEALFNQGIVNNPIRLLLARIYYHQGKYEEVKKILQEGNALESDDKENYYLGDSLIELKDYKASIHYLVNYLKNNKKEYVPYVKLGYAYYMQGLLEPAINAYESAKRLNPDSIEIGQSLKMCINELQKDQTIQ